MASSVHKWLFFTILSVSFLCTSGFRSPEPLHPFYVSVSELEYNAGEKTLEISIKVFTDDFEKALVKAAGHPVDIYKPKDKTQLEKMIADYMRKHFMVKVDGKAFALEYVGYEIEEQSTFSYFQVSNIAKSPKKIELSNNVLFEMNPTQMSIMHVTVNGTRKSTKLDSPNTDAGFEF